MPVRIETTVIGEHGYEQALIGLGLSFGLTAAMSFEDLKAEARSCKDSKIGKLAKVALKLAPKDGGHNKFLESMQVWIDINAPRYWWSEFDTYRVGTSKQSECYDEQTEVLTKDGWKFFRDVTMDDEFATITMDSKDALGGDFEYQKPSKIICDDYRGIMKSFKSNKFDLLVTPDHRMIVYKNGKLSDVLARDFDETMYIPKGCKYRGEEMAFFILPSINSSWSTGFRECTKEYPEIKIEMDNWLKFLGVWLSEGSCRKEQRNYNIIITQNEGEISDEIDRFMSLLPFKVHKSLINRAGKTHNRWTISNKQLFSYLTFIGDTYSKHIPLLYKNLSRRQIGILYDYMFLGDGTKASGVYSTASKELSDDVQEMLLKIGFASNIYTRHKDAFVIYTVNKQVTDNYCIQNKNITDELYDGKIYCVTVPNGTLYVRRNGKATWCGNSTMHTLVKQIKNMKFRYDEISNLMVCDELDKYIEDQFDCSVTGKKPIAKILEDIHFGVNSDTLSDSEKLVLAKGLLPEGFMQRRVVSTNYKVLRSIILQRRGHRLPHWKMFVKDILAQVEHPELLPSLELD